MFFLKEGDMNHPCVKPLLHPVLHLVVMVGAPHERTLAWLTCMLPC